MAADLHLALLCAHFAYLIVLLAHAVMHQWPPMRLIKWNLAELALYVFLGMFIP